MRRWETNNYILPNEGKGPTCAPIRIPPSVPGLPSLKKSGIAYISLRRKKKSRFRPGRRPDAVRQGRGRGEEHTLNAGEKKRQPTISPAGRGRIRTPSSRARGGKRGNHPRSAALWSEGKREREADLAALCAFISAGGGGEMDDPLLVRGKELKRCSLPSGWREGREIITLFARKRIGKN